MALKHPTTPSSEDETEVRTIHEFEMRRRQRLDEPLGPISQKYPRLPADSPWSFNLDELTGKEPPLNEET
jgi:hypothetical protein